MSIRQSLTELGVAGPLAAEFQAQLESGVGNVRRLMELGFVAAPQFVDGLNASTIKPNKLAEVGVPTEVAKYLAKQINTPPTVIVPPTMSGTATVGQVITLGDGVWGTSTVPTFSYSILRGTTQVAATATYTLVAGDVGAIMSGKVTATNPNGSTTANSSNTLGPVVE